MEAATTDSSAAEEDECSDSEVSCLKRVGKHSDWLLLRDNTEVHFGDANKLAAVAFYSETFSDSRQTLLSLLPKLSV